MSNIPVFKPPIDGVTLAGVFGVLGVKPRERTAGETKFGVVLVDELPQVEGGLA